MRAFEGKNKSKPAQEKIPVAETLNKAASIKFVIGTAKELISNLQYACFQAQQALKKSEADVKSYGDQLRAEHKAGILALQDAKKPLQHLITIFDQNRDVVIAALGYPLAEPAQPSRSSPIEAASNLRRTLHMLLAVARHTREEDFIGLLDPLVDCLEGPLLLYNREQNRGGTTGPQPNAIENGLLFHLSYLFRYYTGGGAEAKAHHYVHPQPSGELLFEGPMLCTGRPHLDLVAHLFNATFKLSKSEALNGEQVRWRLSGLLRTTRTKGRKVIAANPDAFDQPFSQVEFFGWEKER